MSGEGSGCRLTAKFSAQFFLTNSCENTPGNNIDTSCQWRPNHLSTGHSTARVSGCSFQCRAQHWCIAKLQLHAGTWAHAMQNLQTKLHRIPDNQKTCPAQQHFQRVQRNVQPTSQSNIQLVKKVKFQLIQNTCWVVSPKVPVISNENRRNLSRMATSLSPRIGLVPDHTGLSSSMDHRRKFKSLRHFLKCPWLITPTLLFD